MTKRIRGQSHGRAAFGRPPHWWRAVLCLVSLAVVGCSTPPTAQPTPDLHVPGVVRLQAVDRLPSGVYSSQIQALAGYRPAAGGTPRFLFVRGDALYDIGADGAGLRLVPTPGPAHCASGVVAIDQGRWAACPGGSGIVLTSLVTPGGGQSNPIAITISGLYFAGPAWSPDSRDVAILTHADGGCTLAIYAVSATFESLHALARLDLPRFVDTGCRLDGLSWSPDGAWLAFVDEDPTRVYSVYAVNLAQLPAALPAATAPPPLPVVETIPDALLVRLGVTRVPTPPGWSYDAGAPGLTFIGSDSWDLVRTNLASGRQMRLLALPVGVSATMVAWTPDGRHLGFVVGPPGCGDCLPYASQMYVYTPPGE